jgi:hypothetical protein
MHLLVYGPPGGLPMPAIDPACVQTQSLHPNEKYLESNGPDPES